uniref:NADH dehydrogenase [ubiquinone] 1 alpha subcomplex subunit 10, mitochondrial n=1 Tax=Simocephalus serrulatus TaxID=117539 RepID=A0A4Y7NNP2_9CRUS|nr:EOG090X05NZ [Simocephalus serrulatus]SVE94217.1 EOG090X05NZ [Simocephalus serrulatus]
MVFFNTCRVSLKLHGNVVVVAAKQQQCVAIQSIAQRSISSKAMRQGLPSQPKPAPFPYKEKRYNFLRALFDPTTSRLDENSKLIIVEGPPAAGKGALAKELAEELDMAYFKSPTVTDSYINDYGYDLRKLDPLLPESCQSYVENDFIKDPTRNHGTKAARFQLKKLELRYQTYLEALAHILNTGQGVVMDRSPYSDMVYVTAMTETGIVGKSVYNYYHRVRNNALFALWRPHLVIYLDVPVAETRRRIEARNRPHEKDSKIATEPYLKSLEESYKKDFLKEVSSHAEVLVYDWTKTGDSEIVVEDVERLDFEKYGVYDEKMKDWRRYDKWDWNNNRQKFTHDQEFILRYLNVPAIQCPEIIIPGEDYKVFENVLADAPGSKYAKGFNSDMGDKGMLFKLS